MTLSSPNASSPSVIVATGRSRSTLFSRPKTPLAVVVASFLLLLTACAGVALLLHPSGGEDTVSNVLRFRRNDLRHRKLLAPESCYTFSAVTNESHSLGDKAAVGNKEIKPNRAWGEDRCSESDIVIDQGPSSPLPNGIPTYSVAILNACSTGCEIGGIHLKCGKFSTARLIDPDIFRRLDYDDCLVNGGRPIPNGMTLSFEYANTYPYPMDILKYECCPV